MKITRNRLKELVRTSLVEENEYQAFFKKALEKTGKSIPSMSDEEKKAFFNKIDAAWNGKGEKKESTEEACMTNKVDAPVTEAVDHMTADTFNDVFEEFYDGIEKYYKFMQTDTQNYIKKALTILDSAWKHEIDAHGGSFRKYNIKLKESVNEGISVSDERQVGKKGIVIMIDDNGKKVSAIFKDKKNADKFNRNNPSDIKKLLDLAKKTKYPNVIDESVNEGKKVFKVNPGIGKAKYSISSHDGIQKHKDGSDFFGIQTFKNKTDLDTYRAALLKKGYKETSSYTSESINEEVDWNTINNVFVKFLKMNTKNLEKFVKAEDLEKTKTGIKSIISGLANAQRSLKLESKLNEDMKFPNMKQWWKETPDDLLAFVYWMKRQTPPKDRDKAYKDIATQLNKQFKAPADIYKGIVGESVNEASTPDTFVSKTKKGYTLIHKGMPLMTSDRTMKDVRDVAKQMKVTIAPKMWNNGKWEPVPTDESVNESSMLQFVSNEMSAGMIANRTNVSDYKSIDKIRNVMIQLLNKKDMSYSMNNVQDLIDKVTKQLKLGESVNEAKVKPNKEALKFLKGMKKVKIKGLGGWMPGQDYVYYDSKTKKWWFTDSDGDHMELKNIGTLKELEKFLAKNNINVKESVNENFTPQDVDSIKQIITTHKKLIGLTPYLKKAGFKDVEFVMMDSVPPHIKIKKGNKTFLIVNKRYVDKPDFVVGDIAGGLDEGVLKKSIREENIPAIDTKFRINKNDIKHPKYYNVLNKIDGLAYREDGATNTIVFKTASDLQKAKKALKVK